MSEKYWNRLVKDLNIRIEHLTFVINMKQEEIERLNNIINEVRELLESKKHCERLLGGVEGKTFTEQALEILNKGDK